MTEQYAFKVGPQEEYLCEASSSLEAQMKADQFISYSFCYELEDPAAVWNSFNDTQKNTALSIISTLERGERVIGADPYRWVPTAETNTFRMAVGA